MLLFAVLLQFLYILDVILIDNIHDFITEKSSGKCGLPLCSINCQDVLDPEVKFQLPNSAAE